MKFTKKTEEQIKDSQNRFLLPKGIYSFEVVDAEDCISKAGNDQIKLKIRIQDAAGGVYIIFDYLLEAMDFKIKHFCDSVGLVEKYQSESLTAEDCISAIGKVEIIIQSDKTGQYADKNAVKDYIKYELIENNNSSVINKNDFVDSNLLDIPF